MSNKDAFEQGAEAMREAVLLALGGRIEREEYGHAKAAVCLDIEAVRNIRLKENPSLPSGSYKIALVDAPQ